MYFLFLCFSESWVFVIFSRSSVVEFINFFSLELQATLATTDTSCESVVTSGQHHLTPQHPPRDASPAGLVNLLLLVGSFSLLALWISLSLLFIFDKVCWLTGFALFLCFLDFCPLQRKL